MTARNPCHGWAHNDPVSYVKADGTILAIGKVSIFQSKAGRWTCQVKLLNAGTNLGRYGDCVWPEGWIWGQGKFRGKCLECGQEFLTNDQAAADEEFCPPCIRKEQRDRSAAGTAIRDHLAYAFGSRGHQPRRGSTPEELSTIKAQKDQDKQESPF